MSFEKRCARSPSPVRLGAKTRQPLAPRISTTRRQHQPPCHAPCTRTKLLGKFIIQLLHDFVRLSPLLSLASLSSEPFFRRLFSTLQSTDKLACTQYPFPKQSLSRNIAL